MAHLEYELFMEDYGTGACIGAIRKGPGDTIGRIYQGQAGGYYSVINFPYVYRGHHISQEMIDKHFGKEPHNLPDEVEYAAEYLMKKLLAQMTAIDETHDVQC